MWMWTPHILQERGAKSGTSLPGMRSRIFRIMFLVRNCNFTRKLRLRIVLVLRCFRKDPRWEIDARGCFSWHINFDASPIKGKTLSASLKWNLLLLLAMIVTLGQFNVGRVRQLYPKMNVIRKIQWSLIMQRSAVDREGISLGKIAYNRFSIHIPCAGLVWRRRLKFCWPVTPKKIIRWPS